MTHFITALDQGYALANTGLDSMITLWRQSLERKRGRHGDKFEEAKALPDLASRLAGLHPETLLVLAATAIDRLSKMEDYTPIPAAIVDLDFESGGEADEAQD